MNLRKTISILFCLAAMLYDGCLDPYTVPGQGAAASYLVVDGFLDAGSNSCSITLTRSVALSSPDTPPAVTDAVVTLLDEDGNTALLVSQGSGVYSASSLVINTQKKYKLHILTSNGNQYESDLVPIQQAPPIDTIGWILGEPKLNGQSISLFVSTHGTADQSRYYLWKFEETWEYTSAYLASLKVVNGQVVSNFENTYFCWSTVNSTSVLINSTSALQENVVNQFTLATLPTTSIKLKEGYSLLVKQLAITKEAFEFWQQVKSNTENLGTIFGPQPSTFSGNIHSTTKASEPVFGYFMASSVSQKRMFIKRGEVPSPFGGFVSGYENCSLDSIPAGAFAIYTGADVLVSSYGLGPVGYLLSSSDCVDCRLHGGTNVKPAFWY
ncbi:MAG: DUF4249 domain-containing protein [Bacteroidetes bacterium]|nr:DUF4249 domain-containing protein [Bacteroidota bacterium]